MSKGTNSITIIEQYKAGVTLIQVPFWWDNTASSLASSIHKFRPELIPHSSDAESIPSTCANIVGTNFYLFRLNDQRHYLFLMDTLGMVKKT